MSRDITPYVLKRQPEDVSPRKLSIDYAAALNPQQLAESGLYRDAQQSRRR